MMPPEAPALSDATAPQTFSVTKLVRFAHTDSAGIVFFPRYFELANAVVEDWFDAALGTSFGRLLDARRGVPTVRIETDFLRPSRLGDRLDFALTVLRVGRSSFTLSIKAASAGEPRVAARHTLVLTDLDADSSVALPAAMRDNMLRYLHEEK